MNTFEMEDIQESLRRQYRTDSKLSNQSKFTTTWKESIWKAWLDRLTGVDSAKATGLLFITLVALIWVAASFLVQEIESEGLPPLILTYIANSLFAILLPVYYVSSSLKAKTTKSRVSETGEDDLDEEEATSLIENKDKRPSTPSFDLPMKYSKMQTFKAALVVAPLWFLAQLTFNLSLASTSVTSNTILSSTASLFTFFLSLWLLKERFTTAKLISILVCMAGTVMVTLGDNAASDDTEEGNASLAGDLLALLAALLYAAYTLAIRVQLPDDDKVSMSLFFGYVGCINFVAVGPVVVLAAVLKKIDVAAITRLAIGLTVAKGLFDNVLSDYLWARAVLLIGPTIATVGMSMQTPIAIVCDIAFKSPAWLRHTGTAVAVLLGGLLVLAGFFGINWATSAQEGEADEE